MSFHALCAAVIVSWWLIGLTGFLFLRHVEKTAMGEDSDITANLLTGGVLVAWIPGPVYWLTLLTVTVVDQLGDHLVDRVANFFLDRLMSRFVDHREGLLGGMKFSQLIRRASQKFCGCYPASSLASRVVCLSLDQSDPLTIPLGRIRIPD